jgi:hypothetical protein
MVIKLKMPKDDQPITDDTASKAQEPAASQPQEDPTTLRDGSTESLSSTFKALVAQDREQRAAFRPTLAKLNEIVSKFHSIGTDEVGIELATFEKLREFNLLSRPGSDQPLYGILSVYEARFLIRVYPDQKVDCYTENLNKPSLAVQSLESDEFWYKTERSSGGTLKINRSEPKFLRYNLENPEDTVSFMSAILQTAASCAAMEDLKQFDLPAARENTLLPKSTRLKQPKP